MTYTCQMGAQLIVNGLTARSCRTRNEPGAELGGLGQLEASEPPTPIAHWHGAPSGNVWRDWAEVSRGHSRFERTEGPNIATTWRSRANLEEPLNPTGRGLFDGQRVTSHEISAMNRPLRTRMVGGVGGGS